MHLRGGRWGSGTVWITRSVRGPLGKSLETSCLHFQQDRQLGDASSSPTTTAIHTRRLGCPCLLPRPCYSYNRPLPARKPRHCVPHVISFHDGDELDRNHAAHLLHSRLGWAPSGRSKATEDRHLQSHGPVKQPQATATRGTPVKPSTRGKCTQPGWEAHDGLPQQQTEEKEQFRRCHAPASNAYPQDWPPKDNKDGPEAEAPAGSRACRRGRRRREWPRCLRAVHTHKGSHGKKRCCPPGKGGPRAIAQSDGLLHRRFLQDGRVDALSQRKSTVKRCSAEALRRVYIFALQLWNKRPGDDYQHKRRGATARAPAKIL